MDRLVFKFYKSYFDVSNELNDNDRLAFYDALLKKQFLGIEPTLKGMSKFAYISQKHSIDLQVKGWEDKMKTSLNTNPTVGGTIGGAIEGAIGGAIGGIEHPDVQEEEKEKVKTTTTIIYSIDKAIEICLRDLEWITATSENCNLDKDKFQYALNDFKKNCISIGRNEDRTLFEFKSHFVNWVKIKKTLKAKETVKDRL